MQCANGAGNPEMTVCFAAGGVQRMEASPYVSIAIIAKLRLCNNSHGKVGAGPETSHYTI